MLPDRLIDWLNHMDFVLYASAVNEDAEYCLSLLNRIPDPNMRSGTHGWSLQRSQTTHVQSDCESSTGSSSPAAAHPSPLMSTRGRELSLHLGRNGFSFSAAVMDASITSRQQRLPTAWSATMWAPHWTASPWWCYIEVVLYRAPPQALPFTNNN